MFVLYCKSYKWSKIIWRALLPRCCSGHLQFPFYPGCRRKTFSFLSRPLVFLLQEEHLIWEEGWGKEKPLLLLHERSKSLLQITLGLVRMSDIHLPNWEVNRLRAGPSLWFLPRTSWLWYRRTLSIHLLNPTWLQRCNFSRWHVQLGVSNALSSSKLPLLQRKINGMVSPRLTSFKLQSSYTVMK